MPLMQHRFLQESELSHVSTTHYHSLLLLCMSIIDFVLCNQFDDASSPGSGETLLEELLGLVGPLAERFWVVALV
jgi:hypothetical protein